MAVEVEEATGYQPPLGSGFRNRRREEAEKAPCMDDPFDEENPNWDGVEGYTSPDEDDD